MQKFTRLHSSETEQPVSLKLTRTTYYKLMLFDTLVNYQSLLYQNQKWSPDSCIRPLSEFWSILLRH